MHIRGDKDRHPPKKPARPHTPSEDENESPKFVEEEAVEVERDIPDTDNVPVERTTSERSPSRHFSKNESGNSLSAPHGKAAGAGPTIRLGKRNSHSPKMFSGPEVCSTL